MANNVRQFVASGNILACRFVKMSGINKVAESDANETIAGISKVGQKYAPTPNNTNYYVAEAGDAVEVYGPGDICMLLAGSGGFAYGDFLKSDADGKGVAILTTGTTAQNIGARALETVAENEYGRVEVYFEHKVYPALA